MRRLVRLGLMLLVPLAVLQAGCGKNAQPTDAGADTRQMDPRRLAAFAAACDNGATIVARQMADGSLELMLPGGVRQLSRVRSASGAKFQGPDVMLWLHGREAMLEADGQLTRCFEDRRASVLEDARARGVRVWGAGKEPDWLLEISENAILLSAGEDRLIFPRTPARESGGDEKIITRSGKRELRITLIKQACEPLSVAASPAPPQNPLDLKLNLDLDGRKFSGCGLDLR